MPIIIEMVILRSAVMRPMMHPATIISGENNRANELYPKFIAQVLLIK
jgi:hypothetical protein